MNLTGAFQIARAAVPELRRTEGRIVNVSSIAGLMGGVAGVHYAASKAGLLRPHEGPRGGAGSGRDS